MQALIAGAGDLPGAIVAASETRPFVAALEGYIPNAVVPDRTFRIETLGDLMADLRERGVTELCLCGKVGRPVVDLGAFDPATRPLIPDLVAALEQGDDGALRAIIGLFEDAGFAVRAAQDLAPALLPKAGILTQMQPYASAENDAKAGDTVSHLQAQEDLGQACVIRDGKVLVREDARGTDVMLARLQDTPSDDLFDLMGDVFDAAADWLSNTPRSGLFYKAPKRSQDRRADLPVIGPDTVTAVAKAGLAGLVIEAGGVIVLHQEQVRRACDAAGLFLWVREP